jgi:hypothetical protein
MRDSRYRNGRGVEDACRRSRIFTRRGYTTRVFRLCWTAILDLVGRHAAGMSSGLRLPANQTHQCGRRHGDKRDRDETGSKNVPETIHYDKSDTLRIYRNPKLGGDDHHILM